MAYTSYITIDGMLIGEITPAGEMRNYGTDSLGSVVTTSLNGVPENTYRYKPYGGLLAKTGTAADPSFLWNGGSGYRATTLPSAGHYVRMRHFSMSTGQWTSVDRAWPSQGQYEYAGSNPASDVDPTGRAGVVVGKGNPMPNCCWNADLPSLLSVAKLVQQTPSYCGTSTGPAGRVGQFFKVNLSMYSESNAPVTGVPTPAIQWWECSDRALDKSGKTGFWKDRTGELQKSGCPYTWKGSPGGCSGAPHGFISDQPSMLSSHIPADYASTPAKHQPVVRNLFIYIAFVPGSNCPDRSQAPQAIQLFQQITYNGTSADSTFVQGWPTQEFVKEVWSGPVACQSPPSSGASSVGNL